ncbi:hypothetical protein P3W24_06740 [Luteibacter sp. PPL201]|uniref:Ankyrin repeat domain-containing protein n=1 Tax=Luteibacter sahnii TaxID=3021977 RepID=A0ABT6B955_9GAMM
MELSVMTTPSENPATPALPVCTTLPATSPDLTRTLAFAVLNRDINGVLNALARGASMDEENDAIEVIHDRIFCDLTAVSLAVLVDAATDSLLMTPLVLNHGGRIDQVDSRGRVLLDFAGSEAVCTYLHQHGAPEPVARDDDPPVASSVRPDYGDDPLPPSMVPEARWRTVVNPKLVRAMDQAGYFRPTAGGPDGSGAVHDASGSPPLVARFSAWQCLHDALAEKSAGRIARLVGMGAADAVPRYDYGLDELVGEYGYTGLTALGLAVLIDSGMPPVIADNVEWTVGIGRPRLARLFNDAVPFTGPQDVHGNTLLHLARSPEVLDWLLQLGLDPDVTNGNGQRPVDVLPEELRVVVERFSLASMLPTPQAALHAETVQRRL